MAVQFRATLRQRNHDVLVPRTEGLVTAAAQDAALSRTPLADLDDGLSCQARVGILDHRCIRAHDQSL